MLEHGMAIHSVPWPMALPSMCSTGGFSMCALQRTHQPHLCPLPLCVLCRTHSTHFPPDTHTSPFLPQPRPVQMSQEFDNDEIKKILEDPNTGPWMKFRAYCARVSGSHGFELFNACVIILNAIVLGLNWWACHICCTAAAPGVFMCGRCGDPLKALCLLCQPPFALSTPQRRACYFKHHPSFLPHTFHSRHVCLCVYACVFVCVCLAQSTPLVRPQHVDTHEAVPGWVCQRSRQLVRRSWLPTTTSLPSCPVCACATRRQLRSSPEVDAMPEVRYPRLCFAKRPALTAVRRYLMPEKLAEAMDVMNMVFTIYFVVEFLIRITGMGPDLYFSTKMNWCVWVGRVGGSDVRGVCAAACPDECMHLCVGRHTPHQGEVHCVEVGCGCLRTHMHASVGHHLLFQDIICLFVCLCGTGVSVVITSVPRGQFLLCCIWVGVQMGCTCGCG